jgi:bifunctional DNA-binding transcriptional regulator/antitoxin component of YhaV-PrlF toxin-antitoxin module
MDSVYHVRLGDSRRLALPAELCRRLDLKPGDELLLTESQDGLAVRSLRRQAERMRQELRDLLTGSEPLSQDLKKLRQAEAAREADPR